MPNICEYDICGRQFTTIHDLILHIEAIHIDFEADYEPNKFQFDDDEFPTQGLPMSLILKYGDDDEIEEVRRNEEMGLSDPVYYCDEKMTDYNDNEPCDYPPKRAPSKAYWYGPESDPKSIVHKRSLKTLKMKKFVCPVVGCTKSYKNANGMKYHVTTYHDNCGNILKTAKVKKDYKCNYCMKAYKTLRGLQTHHQAHKQTRDQMILQQTQKRMYYMNSEGDHPGSAPSSQYYDQDYALHNNGLSMTGHRMSAEVYYPMNPDQTPYDEAVYYLDGAASAAGIPYQTAQLDQFAMHQLMQQSQYNQQNASNVLHKTATNDCSSESPDSYEEFTFLQGSISSETNEPTVEEITTWKFRNGEFDDSGSTRDIVGGGAERGHAEGVPMNGMKLMQQQQQSQQLYERQGYAMSDRSGAGFVSRTDIQNLQRYSRLPLGGCPEGHREVQERADYDQLTYAVERVELCD